ncbi:MAG TPA: CbtA family protein [Egibacteraceae bacterium]|nr:CbtA family protein [Egibacteraceae bacterium]
MLLDGVRRGLAAGLLAGLAAGVFALLVGEPLLDAAIDLEQARTPLVPAEAEQVGVQVTRTQQKAFLVVGSGLTGAATGALFGLAAAWSAGRTAGDAWSRSLKLGAVAVAALVLLPWVKYPPNPPGVGDPATVQQRSALYLGLQTAGLVVVAGAWGAARRLTRAGLWRPGRQGLVGLAVVTLAGAAVMAFPDLREPVEVPASLLWQFRLVSLGTQLIVYGGTAVAFGMLAARGQPRAAAPHLA